MQSIDRLAVVGNDLAGEEGAAAGHRVSVRTWRRFPVVRAPELYQPGGLNWFNLMVPTAFVRTPTSSTMLTSG